MNNYTDWIPALTIAAIIMAVALLWIGIEIYLIRQSIQDRAARATRQRDLINAYYQTAATSLREQTEAGAIKRK
jgi:cell division protein FtsL